MDETKAPALAGQTDRARTPDKGRRLVVGTRGSALALWQTEHVVGRLKALVPALDVTVRRIKTEGDRVQDRPLPELGGKGLFVQEIEEALLNGEIDLAVHSLKDMPTDLAPGLTLGAILERADPRDVIAVRGPRRKLDGLAELAAGARVGTSSLRRRAQLLAARPDLEPADLRGNVDTRLLKLQRGEYDAIILAAAGLSRLGREDAIGCWLPVEVMMPAPGQGALCVEMRADGRDDDHGAWVRALVGRLDHQPTRWATTAERAFLRRLEAGCQAPTGAYGQVVEGNELHLRGLVISPDGQRCVEDEVWGPAAEAEALGASLAGLLLAAGAAKILAEEEHGR